MRDEDLVFYDIEVFRWDSLVILKDINNKTLGVFWNDISRRDAEMSGGKYLDFPTGFEGIEPIVKDKILVGYNNYHYDDLILTYMRNGVMARCDLIYGLNNTIISGVKVVESGVEIGLTPLVNLTGLLIIIDKLSAQAVVLLPIEINNPHGLLFLVEEGHNCLLVVRLIFHAYKFKILSDFHNIFLTFL